MKTNHPPAAPEGGSLTRLVRRHFRIQRTEYPGHFTGFNGCGPMWTSSPDGALDVPQELLWTTMQALCGHAGLCATLPPNSMISGDSAALSPENTALQINSKAKSAHD